MFATSVCLETPVIVPSKLGRKPVVRLNDVSSIGNCH